MSAYTYNTYQPRPNDEAPWELPTDKALIHPAMSPNLGGMLVELCKSLNVSVWDREVVYRAITAIKRE